MISVCIPVYNTDVTTLVTALLSQIERTQIQGEIILFDDGSEDSFDIANKQLADHKGVVYFNAGKNLGRIEARKALAARAQYQWLLFLDGDSQIVKDDFLVTYINNLTESIDVVVGGRIYSAQKPLACQQMLHWKYGTNREKTNGRFVFMTNNFCIRKTIFNQILFPESLIGYGHEDTWMGIQLKQKGARLTFIQNPVLHDGIEDAPTFLYKSEQALKNVLALEQLVDKRVLKYFIKLYHTYYLLKRWHLTWLITDTEKLLHQPMLKNLNSCQPSLLLFDFYRLAYFIRLKKQASTNKSTVKRN